MWGILWGFTLLVYLLGKNPFEANILIGSDIIIPIAVIGLVIKHKKEYGTYF